MPLRIASEKPGVLWNGSFFVHHSLALVNRELTLALLDNEAFTSKFDLSIEQYEPPTFDESADARFSRLAARMKAKADAPVLTVRHRWPPEFSAPEKGRLVLIQPWEFGSLPRSWAQGVAQSVEEVWVPSHFVRETYLRAGVPGEKVVVVPNGVNVQRFHPDVPPYDFAANPKTRHLNSETYKFLFVGGTISRKGIDVLLDAYDRAFTRNDNVTLIIKDFGTSSFYANQGMSTLIQALQRKPGGADIIYLTEDMTEAEIASLYAASDCLVHPYRGEGYGLPIAEAMACGKPTILTGYGAALDFANDANSYLIPCAIQHLPEKRIGDWETVDYPFLAEPDRNALIERLRYVVANRAEAVALGQKAATDIVERHTWNAAADVAAARLIELAERPEQPRYAPVSFGNLKISSSASTVVNSYEDRKQAALGDARASDWETAIQELEACLLERPNDWDTVNALAVARFRTGDTDGALELLRKGLASAPNPRDFHHNLAFVLLATEQPVAALEHALGALQSTPDNADIRRTVTRAQESVLKAARKILRSYPDKQRAQGKRDPEYRALMEKYQQAEDALDQSKLPVAASALSNDAAPPRLSLCMIVKNEERFLRNCLESAKDVVDEIVIVDTGSTDGTLDIAREYGAKIVEHAWNDDFSEARNVSLDHATGNWALWLDADEEIAPESKQKFREALRSAPPHIGGYLVMFRNWLSSPERKEGSEMAIHHAVRLFRRVPGVRFTGRIHEQILRSFQTVGYSHTSMDGLILDHFGYAGEIMTQRNKHERFIRMLKREVEECPQEEFKHFQLFNLGNAYFTFGDMENAARYLAEAAEGADVSEEYTVTLFTELATSLHRLGRSSEGLTECERADALGLTHANIEFARGYCLLHLERYTEAEAAFRKALRFGKEDSAVYAKTGDAGASGFKARYGLSLALVGQDRYAEARKECETTLAEQPGMTDARYLLSICLTRLEMEAEACETLKTLLAFNPRYPDAYRDLGALLFKHEQYAEALPYLQRTAQERLRDPEAQARYAACCETLEKLPEAQLAYRQLRLLRPASAEVCVNLGRVLAASGSEAEAIDCYAEAIQMDPNYGNAYFNAGDLMYRLGYYDRAADTYISGLEVQPAHPDGFFMLGNCYVQTRAYAAAILSYRQALTQNPDHAAAQNNLELAQELFTEAERSANAA